MSGYIVCLVGLSLLLIVGAGLILGCNHVQDSTEENP